VLAGQLRETEVEPFEGTIEYWWKSAREFQERITTPKVEQALKEMMKFQEPFVDSANCSVFFTESDS